MWRAAARPRPGAQAAAMPPLRSSPAAPAALGHVPLDGGVDVEVLAPAKARQAGDRRRRNGLHQVVVALHVRVEDPARADDVVLDLGELVLQTAEAARGTQLGVGLRRHVHRRQRAGEPGLGLLAKHPRRSIRPPRTRASVSAVIVACSCRAYASTACTRLGTRSRRRFSCTSTPLQASFTRLRARTRALNVSTPQRRTSAATPATISRGVTSPSSIDPPTAFLKRCGAVTLRVPAVARWTTRRSSTASTPACGSSAGSWAGPLRTHRSSSGTGCWRPSSRRRRSARW